MGGGTGEGEATHRGTLMDTHAELLLAYGVAEYDTAVMHLRSLRRAGVYVPWSLIGRTENEWAMLARRWDAEHGEPVLRPPSMVTEEVRAWLTDHLDELDQLLTEQGGESEQHQDGSEEGVAPAQG